MTKHTIELAPTGRAKCRGCGKAIEKGTMRLGERLPNPFSDKQDMTHWFHPTCAAFKRPETWLETIVDYEGLIDSDMSTELTEVAKNGLVHKRLSRVDGAQRASSGRAKCRHCKETIDKGTWRISLVYYEDGRFNPSGYIHPGCCAEYLGTVDVLGRVRHFSPELGEEDIVELSGTIPST